MKRAVSLQLFVPSDQGAALTETIMQFTAVFNAVCMYGWQHRIRNGVTLHHRLYRSLKTQYPTLVSSLHIQARVKATEALKSALTRRLRGRSVSCPQSRACPPRHNRHTFTVKRSERTVRLSTTAGRLTFSFRIGPHAARYTAGRICTADLIRRSDGTFWLHVIVEVQAPNVTPTDEVIGVDLGLAQPAVTSMNGFLGERRWRAVEARHFRHRRALQRCGTKSAKRRLRQLRGRQRRFRRNCDHVLSKQIVSCVAPGAVIVLERLTGIRVRVRHRHGKQNRRFHSWSFAQLRKFIEYKAEERGCTVAAVDPRHTSQRCSRCGYRSRTNRRSRALFRCRACGLMVHADLNGARNIAAAYRACLGKSGAGGLPVNQPDVALVLNEVSSRNLSSVGDGR